MAYNHNDKRQKLVDIFWDTINFIGEDEDLYNCTEYSKKETEIIPSDEYYELEKPNREGKIKVTRYRTFEAAMRYAQSDEYSDKLIAVLNFASATTPGGGVTKGSTAQEECLCRCSTLYPVLSQSRLETEFYTVNRRQGNPLHSDDIIYSPDIIIIKSDEDFPERLDKDEWCKTDVITCAAPNLRPQPSNKYNSEGNDNAVMISSEDLYDIHLSRAQHILNVAAGQGVEVLILGAFGCGAFMNDPQVVARAYKDALEEYAGYFDVVEFAVYTSAFDEKNFRVFNDILGE